MNPWYKNLAFWVIIIFAVFLMFSTFEQSAQQQEVTYSEFLQMVDRGEVDSVSIQGKKITLKKNDKEWSTYAPEDQSLIPHLTQKGIDIKAEPPSDNSIGIYILQWLPMIVLLGVWIFFMRQMQSGGGKAMSFGKSRARLMSDQLARVTFDDVAGVDEALEELSEIVEFLRDPRKFTRLGGRIPKGVLLMGPPGSGKTLLARAIAGEAEVPFFTISGSDFVEMFVGVGASRVRDLFMQGKKSAPCIIFIDEIDAVGRHRGAGLGGGHDEREQTLNQLLVEMDGFESNEGVILISATNRPDVLDPALLRPGRFDRQVVVPLPDIRGRKKILEVHMKKTPIGDDVDAEALAKGTAGFSGADLENLVNETALLAAKKGKDKLEMMDFEESKDKVYMGLARKTKIMSKAELRMTAYHEGGHALVARFLPGTRPVNKVTIIPRGRALGVTWFLSEDRVTQYKDQLESELAVAYGGRVAEDLIFKRISTGAANDIKQATETAQRMVREWGMSEKMGPLSYAQGDEQVFLGREIAKPRDYSEETARQIDQEVKDLITSSYEKAVKLLTDNVDILHALSDLLLKKETIMGAELDELIHSMRPGLELPSEKLKREMEEEEGEDAPEEGQVIAPPGPTLSAKYESAPETPENSADAEDIELKDGSDPHDRDEEE
ncbi:membrane protease FtsH catalytic subunit [Desulfatibacillum alkenivorans DSM 16219]|uniref:ATP-dependent zinc metalloprotease FtsH n=1 Tax=Desulfatibacillum alkenivorans DSM 16219 TaxID=1121393 RepID=A0A1M6Y1G0_9BACT|nr:ATP-dependent zinc metalloprotease FtsH [Desulfatibacillum alkenivorans]SHL12016.1 membrane protease FtsH catalytic subunit [Desulfatibacillum alkenivorans DSM 16219]